MQDVLKTGGVLQLPGAWTDTVFAQEICLCFCQYSGGLPTETTWISSVWGFCSNSNGTVNLDHKLVTTDSWFIFSGEIFFSSPYTEPRWKHSTFLAVLLCVEGSFLVYLFTEGSRFWCPSSMKDGSGWGWEGVSITRLSAWDIFPFLGSSLNNSTSYRWWQLRVYEIGCMLAFCLPFPLRI